MDGIDVIDQTTDTDLDLGTQDDQQQTDDTTQDDAQHVEEKLDGRKFNPEWSKALKELNELYPDRKDMFTKLRDNYARYQTLQELAPKGIEDVRQWKTTLDALGGSEAAADMMQRVASMEQIDSKIEAADDSFVEELPENLQKGIFGMVPQLLSRLAEKDSAAFEATVLPHFQAALAGTGMGDHLKEMYTLAEGNAPLQAKIKAQYDWFQQQTSGAGKMSGGQKTVSPEVQRLQAQIDTHRKADDEAFVGGITESTNKYVTEAFDKEAAVYLKQLNLSDAQKTDLMESFNAKLVDKLGSDTAFQKQLAAYKSLKNRSPETVNNYIRGKVDEVRKSIMDGLVTARYGGMRTKKAETTAGTATTTGGATRVATPPPQDQWDMSKMESMGYENTVKKGIFHLTGGRTVQLVRQ